MKDNETLQNTFIDIQYDKYKHPKLCDWNCSWNSIKSSDPLKIVQIMDSTEKIYENIRLNTENFAK